MLADPVTALISLEEEQRLLERALSGGEDEVMALVRYLELHIRRTAHGLCGRLGRSRSRGEANDLVQMVFEALFAQGWRVLTKWDPERRVLLRTYVNVVAVRTMRAQLEKEERRSRIWGSEQAEVGTTMDPVFEARSTTMVLLRELSERLSEASRRVFEMLFLEERDIDETATALSISVSAVRSHKKRIRQEARTIMAELGRHQEHDHGHVGG